jgi:hypothetical protein
LAGLALGRAPADQAGQSLLTLIVVRFAEDLQVAIEDEVRLRGPKFRGGAKDIDKEGKKNKAEDRDTYERQSEG